MTFKSNRPVVINDFSTAWLACKQRFSLNLRFVALVYFLFWCIYPIATWLILGLEPLSIVFVYTLLLTTVSLLFFVEFSRSAIGLFVTTILVALLTVDIFLVNTHQTRISSSIVFVALNESSLAADFINLQYKSILLHLLIFASLVMSMMIMRRGKSISGVRLFVLSASIIAAISLSFLFHKFYYKLPDTTALFVTLQKDRGSLLYGPKQIALATKVKLDFQDIFVSRSQHNIQAKTELTKGIYVLVIGESSRPQSWQINGYGRETNPRLALRDNLFFFTDLITTAPLTMDAVVSMLSLSGVERWDEVMRTPSIISIIKKAGIRTEWLSVQPVDSWSGLTSYIASEADHKIFFDSPRDDVLLNEFRERLPSYLDANQPVFVVLHTWGSHYRYATRYPDSFNKWQSKSPMDAYDNSILYTDYILDQLISTLEKEKNTPSVVFYFSDHGENLNDNNSGIMGHPFGTEYDLRTSGFVWTSEYFMKTRSADLFAIERNKNKQVSLSHVSHSILDLMKIDFEASVEEKSFFSEDFKETERKYRLWEKIHNYERPQ